MFRYRDEFLGAAPVDVVAREAGYGHWGDFGAEEFFLYGYGGLFGYQDIVIAGGAESLADGFIDNVGGAAFADLLGRDGGVADFGSAYLNDGYRDGRTEGASAFSYVAVVVNTVEQDALMSAAARIKKYFFIVVYINNLLSLAARLLAGHFASLYLSIPNPGKSNPRFPVSDH